MHTLIIGLDAFDPTRFEHLAEQAKLPNLTRYVEAGGYSRFEVANPPQTEVSWTSIATGLNPGGHGIFDFVHRDPATYTPYVSLLPTKRGVFGTQFVPPFKSCTIFEEAARQGFPATALWWPAMFPARPELPVHILPGLGTPDIQGRLGVGAFFCSDSNLIGETRKTPVESLEQRGKDRYIGLLKGPVRKKRKGAHQSTVELLLDRSSERSAHLSIGGGRTIELVEGQWSPILEISFEMGRWHRIRALTRVLLNRVQPDIRLYALPLQIHPLHTPWRYAAPGSFVKQVWTDSGPFLTLGMPQDTTGLEDGCITDEQFLDLCESILSARERVLLHRLEHFHEGILASVFDSLDRVQHMFWRDRPDVVDEWYRKLDALIGKAEQRLVDLGKDQTRIIVVSDHGFARFDYKVHLNRWLIEHGYLVLAGEGEPNNLQGVDWSQSQAYAVGLNSLYVNLSGREGQGSVQVDQYDLLTNRLRGELLDWHGPDGRPVVRRVWRQEEAFTGPFAKRGPDIVVGYSSGYRASAETGLGEWGEVHSEPNRDHWGADHCIDPQAVPGVLFSNQGLGNHPHPSYRDIPVLAIGMPLDQDETAAPPPSPYSDEDREIVEERLRSLGYL